MGDREGEVGEWGERKSTYSQRNMICFLFSRAGLGPHSATPLCFCFIVVELDRSTRGSSNRMADRDNAVERLHKMLSNNSLDLERLQKTLDSCLQQLDLQKGETIINSYYSGMTAVHLAAKNDSHDCLVYLLWRGGEDAAS